MKRESQRIIGTLPPEKLAELRQVRETIDREEKPRIVAKLRQMQEQERAAAVELTRVAALLNEAQATAQKDSRPRNETTEIASAAICRLEQLVETNPTIGTLNRLAQALGKKLVVALADQ